jgi:hypothetical protein
MTDEEAKFEIKGIVFDYTFQTMLAFCLYQLVFELITMLMISRMMGFKFNCCYTFVKLIAAFSRRLTQNL